ncbi:MAG: NADP-dependent 3-hydroxy acid dehydrogenase YdfG [Gammaproteobacteria bacterium]|jgi:NADP-dependent 3-hydroxy acid dehydrogenase YdfG
MLVNNVGNCPVALLEDSADADWDQAMEMNINNRQALLTVI